MRSFAELTVRWIAALQAYHLQHGLVSTTVLWTMIRIMPKITATTAMTTTMTAISTLTVCFVLLRRNRSMGQTDSVPRSRRSCTQTAPSKIPVGACRLCLPRPERSVHLRLRPESFGERSHHRLHAFAPRHVRRPQPQRSSRALPRHHRARSGQQCMRIWILESAGRGEEIHSQLSSTTAEL